MLENKKMARSAGFEPATLCLEGMSACFKRQHNSTTIEILPILFTSCVPFLN
tara:strand:+ start:155 stop:310 length:156 start_codon:yes stop_codon:yes gene_type:complete